MRVDSKRYRPPGRDGFVQRSDLILRLRRATDVRVVLVTAAAGYGKTTLLAQWAAADRRPFAWVSLTDSDNNGDVLTCHIAEALRGIPPRSSGYRAPGPTGPVEALAQRVRPFVLVLDGAHVLRDSAALSVVTTVFDELCLGSQLVIAGRSEPDLPLARWQVQRDLLRIGPDELAMTPHEADALLRAAGLQLEGADLDRLLRHTEGWAPGLYLAALSIKERRGASQAVSEFGGNDRFVAAYLREELLAHLPIDLVRFMRRTSVLHELSGRVCNAVLQRADSGAVLRELERSNAFIVSLDRRQERFRYHHLLAEMLRAELRCEEPQVEQEVHRRASAWYEANSESEQAIGHARAAGDVDRAAELIWASLPDAFGSGHLGTLHRWMEGIGDRDIAAHPALAMVTAWCRLDDGDATGAAFWALTAERSLSEAPSVGRTGSLVASAAALRALAAVHGVTRMGDDAALGLAAGAGANVWRHVCCFLEGVARRLRGQSERARERLEEAVWLSGARGAPAVLVPSLAQLALLATADDDWEVAGSLVARARTEVARSGLTDRTALLQMHSAASLVLAHQGQAESAGDHIHRAVHILNARPQIVSWLAIDARIALARANLLIGDATSARVLISETNRRLGRTPDAGVLGDHLKEVRERADAFWAAGVLGPSALSKAELRVLGFLPTHLSYREIGGRLHLSQYTVKTQALAIFRKLDVSCRSEAVERAGILGLISGQSWGRVD